MGARVRLKRLLGLVENATVASSRALAVERITSMLREEQQRQSVRNGSCEGATCSEEAPLRKLVLERIVQFVRSPSWDIRVTGARLFSDIVAMQPDDAMAAHFAAACEASNLIRMDELDMTSVIKNGRPLVSQERKHPLQQHKQPLTTFVVN